MTTVISILEDARATLSRPGAWTPVTDMGRTRTGAICPATDPKAVMWGVIGAVYRSFCMTRTIHGPSWTDALAALVRVRAGDQAIGDWERARGRTQEDVLALLDRAIDAEKGRQAA